MLRNCQVCNKKTSRLLRCNDCYRCDDCHTREKIMYSDGGVLCETCRKKRIEKYIEEFSANNEDTPSDDDYVICPHCGYEHDYAFEFEHGTQDCERCERKFHLTIETTSTYITDKDVDYHS